VSQPFLDFGNISIVVEGIGGCSGAQRVSTDLEAKRQGVAAHEFINTIQGDGVVELAGAVIAYGSKQRPLGVGGVSRFIQESLSNSWVPVCSGM
jgi:hypothetical protein